MHIHDQSPYMQSESMCMDKKMMDGLDSCHGLMNELWGAIGNRTTENSIEIVTV